MPCPSCSSAYLDQYGRCPVCGYAGGFPPPTGRYPGAYYAPPAAPVAPTGISLAAQILIGVSGLAAVLAGAVNIYGYTLSSRVLDNADVSHSLYDQAHTASSLIGGMGGLMDLLNIATGVVFIIWCYKSARLSAVLAPGRQPLPVGMSIGGWFIPLAFLVLPRLTMGGIWRASEPLRDTPMMRKPGTQLVTYWWITFAIAQLGVNINLPTLSTPDQAINDSHTETLVRLLIALAVLALRVVSAVLGVIMLRRLTARQQVRILQGPGAGHPYSAAAYGGYGEPQPPYQPEPYAPQGYAPQPYAPQPYAPAHQQQPQAYIPTQPPAPAEAPAETAAAESAAAPQDAVPEPAVDLGKGTAEDQARPSEQA